MSGLHVEPYELDTAHERQRMDVRAFLAETLPDDPGAERTRGWFVRDPAFSRRLGARGCEALKRRTLVDIALYQSLDRVGCRGFWYSGPGAL